MLNPLRTTAIALAVAALLALTACSSVSTAGSPHVASSASRSYDNSQACAAFNDAITTGIPSGQSDYTGEDTMSWLYRRIGNADPTLKAMLITFTDDWDSYNAGEVSQPNPPSSAPITAYCKAHQ